MVQSREKSSDLLYNSIVANEKGAFGLPSTTVGNFTFTFTCVCVCVCVCVHARVLVCKNKN